MTMIDGSNDTEPVSMVTITEAQHKEFEKAVHLVQSLKSQNVTMNDRVDVLLGRISEHFGASDWWDEFINAVDPMFLKGNGYSNGLSGKVRDYTIRVQIKRVQYADFEFEVEDYEDDIEDASIYDPLDHAGISVDDLGNDDLHPWYTDEADADRDFEHTEN
jgi:hypothetical protein